MPARVKAKRAGPLARGSDRAITRQIAAFVAAARYESLPAAAIEAAKDSFLDTLGIAIAGAVEPAARIITRYALQSGGSAESSLVGCAAKVPARVAAEVNGTLAHIVGFSDFSVPNVLHPSVAVLPAVWAVGEARRASGKALLLAHVLGVEVSCKIAGVLTPAFTQRGFHPCAAVGTFGAAAAAGKLLGLDAAALSHALGIAGVRAAGIKVSLGTMSKAYAVGNAAGGGVAAAELAAVGFTGPDDVLEGRDGFLQTFGGGVESAALTDVLGNPYEFEHPGIAIKPYPACTRAHPAIDSAIDVSARPGFAAVDIDAVECEVAPAVLQVVKISEPRNPMEAKFSLPFCIATALLDRDISMETFTEAKLNDAGVRRLMQRVRPRAAESLARRGSFAARLTVRMKNGATLQAQCDRNLWDQPGVATRAKREQLVRKFRHCAGRVLGEDEIVQVMALAEALEGEPNLDRLMGIARIGRASH